MLTNEQINAFHEDGFVEITRSLDTTEIAKLRREIDRLAATESDCVLRQGNTINVYRAHQLNGPTASPIFHALAHLPRLVDGVRQLLGRSDLYIYNSHVFGKAPLNGAPMMWHQDFGYWRLDGVLEPRMVKVMVTLGDTSPLGGCLYFIPGSHKLGGVKHFADGSAQFKHWTIESERMKDILRTHRDPVPVGLKAGTVAFFHGAAIHGSGHNLSGTQRWQAYVAYNTIDNKPIRHTRPDRFCSTDYTQVEPLSDDALRTA